LFLVLVFLELRLLIEEKLKQEGLQGIAITMSAAAAVGLAAVIGIAVLRRK
jgi:hypothetical protein